MYCPACYMLLGTSLTTCACGWKMLDSMPRQDLELPPPVGFVSRAEHDRIVADYLAVIDHLHHEHDYWRGRAEFAEAQFEALAEMAPPPQKGLLLRRLKELAAKRGGERKP